MAMGSHTINELRLLKHFIGDHEDIRRQSLAPAMKGDSPGSRSRCGQAATGTRTEGRRPIPLIATWRSTPGQSTWRAG
jgi:hypothetical protein